jgi:hypothetical protein
MTMKKAFMLCGYTLFWALVLMVGASMGLFFYRVIEFMLTHRMGQ